MDYFDFRWKLWKLNRSLERLEEAHRVQLEDLKKGSPSRETLYEIDQEHALDYSEHQQDVRTTHSRYLVSRASELIVPIPKLEDKTIWGTDYMGRTTLTDLGITTVRSAVRAERKARLEMFLMWVPGIVGILGTLIGLASVLLSKR